jgi:hypothetical protein
VPAHGVTVSGPARWLTPPLRLAGCPPACTLPVDISERYIDDRKPA